MANSTTTFKIEGLINALFVVPNYYHIIEKIISLGSYGVVVKATDLRTNTIVAIK